MYMKKQCQNIQDRTQQFSLTTTKSTGDPTKNWNSHCSFELDVSNKECHQLPTPCGTDGSDLSLSGSETVSYEESETEWYEDSSCETITDDISGFENNGALPYARKDYLGQSVDLNSATADRFSSNSTPNKAMDYTSGMGLEHYSSKSIVEESSIAPDNVTKAIIYNNSGTDILKGSHHSDTDSCDTVASELLVNHMSDLKCVIKRPHDETQLSNKDSENSNRDMDHNLDQDVSQTCTPTRHYETRGANAISRSSVRDKYSFDSSDVEIRPCCIILKRTDINKLKH